MNNETTTECLKNFKLYDYLPIGICIIDSDYSIVYWNLCLEGWTGIKSNEIVGSNLLEKFPNLNDKTYTARFDLMFTGRPPMVFSSLLHKYLFPAKLSNGELQVQSATITSIPKPGADSYFAMIAIENVTNLSGRIASYRDMKNKAIEELNKRRLAEDKLKEHSAKLEQLNATKDKFFSIIAHDLINPISSQYKIIEHIVHEFQSYSKAELLEILEELWKSSKNTYRLLDELLTWSRSQLNKIVCNQDSHQLKKIIDTVYHPLQVSAVAKSITVRNLVDEDTWVYVDFNMMSTVVRNLLSNAIKFTDTNGEITINAEKDGEYVFVHISDNGLGMSETVLNSLFRIDKAISQKGTNGESGTGLGLILCKEFIEKNQGRIDVESHLGVGSTFTIQLIEGSNEK